MTAGAFLFTRLGKKKEPLKRSKHVTALLSLINLIALITRFS